MDVKRDILWRVYLSYLLVFLACAAIFAKAVYIQQVEGKHWRSMSDSLHQKVVEIEAERGTIYSEDGQMLSTSIPQFDIYIDFRVAPLREKNGQKFRENVDSLSGLLADLFKDRSAAEYKNMLELGYQQEESYFPLKKKVSYKEYQALIKFPLVRLGRYKSGFIAQEKTIRLNPYQTLAFRTIGLARDNHKVGLELTYDSLLKGKDGKQFVRKIAGGVTVPVNEAFEVEPETGKDIVSTIDVFIQDVTENALMKMMIKNDAVNGCAIVMEVKTGKIKAIANLGKSANGNYYEDLNYAITPSEPGSTFKLTTLMALLEDKKVNLSSHVNLEGGVWRTAGQVVYDSERHGRTDVTIQQAFELSSNVGMAKLAMAYYAANPKAYFDHLHNWHIDEVTGIDLVGEKKPVIYRPGSKWYGPTTLPWMSFGYNIAISPLQTTMLYNAIANNGRLMHPYLVSAIKEEGLLIKQFSPKVVAEKICSEETIRQLKICLEGVCINGTAKELFKDNAFSVAGKTGTAKVANGNKGYNEHIYQSSFAGYFPAENPQYTCVVVIKNKPFAPVYYGGAVAGPVFKEIADHLATSYLGFKNTVQEKAPVKDSAAFSYAGTKADIAFLSKKLAIPYLDSSSFTDQWVLLNGKDAKNIVQKNPLDLVTTMSSLKGMGLKDVIASCESKGLKLEVRGKGKVVAQSILPGSPFVKGQTLIIELN